MVEQDTQQQLMMIDGHNSLDAASYITAEREMIKAKEQRHKNEDRGRDYEHVPSRPA